MQVSEAVGLTFAAALRSILRQAPNVIMIGEIRDLETATIAINASLTGHLVFSTLHTNDAPGAVTRLIDIGVKPFLVASSTARCDGPAARAQSVRAVQGAVHGDPEMLRASDFPPEVWTGMTRSAPRQRLPEVQQYRLPGRLGLFEYLRQRRDAQAHVRRKAPTVGRAAAAEGMRTLREDGIRKVLAG